MRNENNDNKIKWIRCKNCGHKLMKVLDNTNKTTIEIKCSSCKAITVIDIK